jgi:ABC-type lipoprotein release transport system permease subunit
MGKKLTSALGNIVLYAFLLWLLYDSTIHEWDPWFAFVVGFVLVLAVVISLIPALRAPSVSPGEYPYDD